MEICSHWAFCFNCIFKIWIWSFSKPHAQFLLFPTFSVSVASYSQYLFSSLSFILNFLCLVFLCVLGNFKMWAVYFLWKVLDCRLWWLCLLNAGQVKRRQLSSGLHVSAPALKPRTVLCSIWLSQCMPSFRFWPVNKKNLVYYWFFRAFKMNKYTFFFLCLFFS